MRNIFLSAMLTLLPIAALSETLLYMVEQDGCCWCARWDRDIAHIYSKTPEGQAAPLQRIDIASERPFAEERRILYTPTFILTKDAIEVGRIEGYPGEDAFWSLLQTVFARAEIQLSPQADMN